MKLKIPSAIKSILDEIIRRGGKPVLVGGFVRDSILGKTSKDLDIEVFNLSLDELQNALQKFGPVKSVGKSFGILKLNFKNYEMDFAIPRKESKKGEHHQDFDIQLLPHLKFKEAASRRDFTINSMGLSYPEEEILDPFNGLNDCKNKILRAVGDHFDEDALRVLRAAYFSGRFGFKLDEDLVIRCQKIDLSHLSVERIYAEFVKIFTKCENPSQALINLKILTSSSIFSEIFTLSEKDFMNTSLALDQVPKKEVDNLLLYFSLLCSKLKNPLSLLKNISYPDSFNQKICQLIHTEKNIYNKNEEWLRTISLELKIESLLNYHLALRGEKTTLYLWAKKLSKKEGFYNQPIRNPLQGRDLQKLGIEEGLVIGFLLQQVMEARLMGLVSSWKDSMRYIRELLQ